MTKPAQQIPAGWGKVTLGEVADVKNGKTNSQDAQEYGDYPLFDRSSDIKRSNKFLFDSKAIIIPGEGAEFIPKYFSGKFDLHQRAYAAYNFREGIVPRFVYYNIDHFKKYFEKVSVGSTVKSLRLPHLIEYPILLPPLSEQTRIAAILSKVDEEIETVERIIEQTEKLKKGLMEKLLTKGIGHTKFKQTELGEIPEEWEVVRLEEIAAVERGKFSHRPRNDKRFYGGDIPFIQTGDIVNCNGKIEKYTQTLNEQGLAVSRKFAKGTIVLTIAANIGDTGILTFESCFPDSLVGINVTQKMDNEFLEYYLRTRKAYLNKISTQSAQKNINLEKLRPLLLIQPPKNEQQEIARILNSLETKISNIKKIKFHLLQLKKGLMDDLLSGRVRTKT